MKVESCKEKNCQKLLVWEYKYFCGKQWDDIVFAKRIDKVLRCPDELEAPDVES